MPNLQMCFQVITCFCLVLMVVKKYNTLEIIQAPDMNVWVEERKNISLVCTSNHRWQWCYWEHDIFNKKTVYQTVQEYTSMDTYDPQIKFNQLLETSCGLEILDASTEKHQVA